MERHHSTLDTAVTPEQPDRLPAAERTSQYELEYDLPSGDSHTEHERWLFEWCLDCVGAEPIEEISVVRRPNERRESVRLLFDVRGNCESVNLEMAVGGHLADLERRVGEYTIAYR